MSSQRYRKISPRIWNDERFSRLDLESKLITLLSLTSPQSNRIGMYSISRGYACDLIGITQRRFLSRFRSVCDTFGWKFDENRNVLLISSWWKYNPPENLSHLKGMLTDLNELPRTALFKDFCSNIKKHLAGKGWDIEKLLAEYAEQMEDIIDRTPARRCADTTPPGCPPQPADLPPTSGTGTGTGAGTETGAGAVPGLTPPPPPAPSTPPPTPTPTPVPRVCVPTDTPTAGVVNVEVVRGEVVVAAPEPLKGEVILKPAKQKSPPVEYSETFEKFWAAYPKRIAKAEAAKAFAKIKVTPELLTRMIAAIERAKKTYEWAKEGGQFIPHAATWLNRGQWDDEPTIVDPEAARAAQPPRYKTAAEREDERIISYAIDAFGGVQ